MPMHLLQPSFGGGELAPALHGRVELAKHAVGCKTVKNFIIHPAGGASNRPGTRFVAAAKYSDKLCRLVEFEFSTEQAYVIEFGDHYCRFYKDGGQIIHTVDTVSTWATETEYSIADSVKVGAVIYRCTEAHTSGATTEPGVGAEWEDVWIASNIMEVYTPYVEADLARLRFTQSADVLYIVHPDYAPRTLTRTSHTSWELAAFEFEGGPFMIVNADENKTITPSGTTGDITLESSFDLFTANHAGSLFKLNHHVESQTINGSFVGVGFGTMRVGGKLRDKGDYSPTVKATGDWTLVLGGSLWVGHPVLLQKSVDGGQTWSTVETYMNNGTYTGAVTETCLLRVCRTESGVGTVEYTLTAEHEQELKCHGPWRLTTHGTWKAKIRLEKSDDNGTTWKAHRHYSSANDKNWDVTGEENEPCLLRLQCYEYTSGTVEFDFTADPYTHGGIAQISSVTDSKHANAKVIEELGAVTATDDWAEGSWSDCRGWPSVVTFYEDRLCFGGTYHEPQGAWCSHTSDYTNFAISNPIVDTDRIALRLNSRKVNAIRGLVGLDDLIPLTSDSEWKVGSGDDIFAPATVRQKAQSYNGAADVEPLAVDNRVIYVQAKGSRLRDLGYSFEANGYAGHDLSIYAEHLVKGHELLELAYQDEPDHIIWAVRDDGVLLGLTYMNEQQVLAWHQHVTDGEFESICVIPADGYDELWAVVKRTINGATVRYVERFAERIADPDAPEDSFFVDCGLSYDDKAATSFAGLGHLEGEEVAILADGVPITRQEVTDGEITLPAEASVVHIGLPYTCDLEPLSIEAETDKGTLQSQLAQCAEIVIRFLNSGGGSAGPDTDNLDDIIFEDISDGELFSGLHKQSISSDWRMAGTILIRQDDPLPMTVLSIAPKVTVGG